MPKFTYDEARGLMLADPELKSKYDSTLATKSTPEHMLSLASAILGAGLGLFVDSKITSIAKRRAAERGEAYKPSTALGRIARKIVLGGGGALAGYFAGSKLLENADAVKKWRRDAADNAINVGGTYESQSIGKESGENILNYAAAAGKFLQGAENVVRPTSWILNLIYGGRSAQRGWTKSIAADKRLIPNPTKFQKARRFYNATLDAGANIFKDPVSQKLLLFTALNEGLINPLINIGSDYFNSLGADAE